MNLAHRLAPLAIVAMFAAGCGSPADAAVSAAAARAELRGLIEEVTSATATRYRATDPDGNRP